MAAMRGMVHFCLLALLLTPRVLLGQGTGGFFADPISTVRATDSADQLGLEGEQRAAFLALHRDYVVSFLALRESRISQFLDQPGVFQLTLIPSPLPDRTTLERLLREHRQIESRIASLDEGFFDRVTPMLGHDEQVRVLQALRAARERERLRSSGITTKWLAPLDSIDVDRILATVSISDSAHASVAPVISRAQSNLTRHLRKLSRASRAHLLTWCALLEEQGIRSDPLHEDGGFAIHYQAVIASWQASRLEVREMAAELIEDQMRDLLRLASALPPEEGYLLRRTLIDMEALARFEAQKTSPDGILEAALALPDLAPAGRSALEQVRTSYRASWSEIADDALMAAAECYGGQSMIAWSEQDYADQVRFQEKKNGLRQAAEHLRIATLESMRAVLGEGRVKAVVSAHEREHEERSARTASDDVLGRGVEARQLAFIPFQIRPADIERWRQILRLDEQQCAILDVLHRDYRDAIRRLRQSEIEQLASRRLEFALSDDGEPVPPSLEEIESDLDARRRTLEAIEQLDEAFLADLQMTLSSDPQRSMMAIVRLDRAVSFCTRPHSSAIGSDTAYSEHQASLVEAAFWAPNEETRQAVLTALLPHVDAMIGSMRRHLGVQLDHWHVIWVYQHEWRALSALGASIDEIQSHESTSRAQASAHRLILSHCEIVELNRKVLDALCETLPEGEAKRLRWSYSRNAYPNEYLDPRSALPHLDAALRLDDLSSEQADAITTLRTDFVDGWETVSFRIGSVYAESPNQGIYPYGGVDWARDRDRRRNEIGRLRFERDELNARTIEDLRAILSEGQFAQIRDHETGEG